MLVTSVNIQPVKPNRGLIAFASVTIDDSLYLGSIAVYTRPDGSYRLLYPAKKVGDRSMDIFHPINRSSSRQIEEVIFKKCDEIFENDDKQQLQLLG